ncbi:MAG TPA: hypothetical protein DCM45_03220 [Clostridiales bacterium]|nr:hypothetical protein [Clostridiales bacterium]
MALALWPRKLHFLTTSSFFRYPLTRWVLQNVQAIPKIQFRTDIQATKQMFSAIRAGGAVAILPEGQCSLDGSCSTIDNSIAKMVKKTGCPVAAVRTRGAYLVWPRWSQSGIRLGRIEATAQLLLDSDEVAILSIAEIQTIIEKALTFNDYGWQHRRRKSYLSFAPAAGVHNLCHQCPACGQILAMTSTRHRLTCRFCGNEATMDRFGFFSTDLRNLSRDHRPKIKPDPYRWHQWQLQEISKKMNETEFILEFPAEAELLGPDGNFTSIGRCLIKMTATGISFTGDPYPEENRPALQISLPYDRKAGISFDFGQQFEIALGDLTYRFRPDNGQAVILVVDAILASADSRVT